MIRLILHIWPFCTHKNTGRKYEAECSGFSFRKKTQINSIKIDSHKFLNYKELSLTIIFLLIAYQGFSQPTTITGKVTDQETGKPVPYASIIFKNTTTGALSDSLGCFDLTTKAHVDSVYFSSVGYFSKAIGITSGQAVELQVVMKSDLVNISEVSVRPDDGPVRRILQEIIDRKNQNNPMKYSRYSFRKYTKWEYHINNVGQKLMQSKAFRNNQSVFKPGLDNSHFLPVYFSEQLVYNEFQRNPLKQKSTVLADKTSGISVLNDFEISGYTSALDMEVNFYDNFINLFSQNFVSPLADNGWFYYKYYLADSTIQNGSKFYKIDFFPRRLGDKVFKGYLTTETKNYSLLEIDGILANTEYLNFLKSMRLKSNYQLVDDSIPFFRRNQIDAVFNYVPGKNKLSKKPISLFFTQSAVIDSVSVNQPEEVSLANANARYETIKLPEATQQDKNYWNTHRLEKLNPHETNISGTIDSVNQIKAVKLADNLTRMILTGYYDLGKFEFGPYPRTINTNKLEGLSVFAGMRTSDEISTRYMIWGGIGYGLLNQEMNWMAGFGYKFPAIYRRLIKVSYDDKIIRAGENDKILYLYENTLSATESNIISQVFKRDALDELYREQKLASSFEYEWYPGLINKINANYIVHFSPGFYPFLQKGNPVGHVSATDFSVDTRFSWQEKLIDDKFLRIYMATEYPIIHVTLGGGQIFYSGKQNYYGKIHSTVEQYLMLGQAGLNYALEAGMYFGKLPYTMLDIPRGNETYGLYQYDFNLMNYMEYIHDKYLHAYLEYHLNGFLFNRVPLLKRTGLREVFSAKGLIGSLSDQHQQIIEFPLGTTRMNNPYIELGAGVENIFRLFRIDAVWRVCPQSTQRVPSFGLRANLQIRM